MKKFRIRTCSRGDLPAVRSWLAGRQNQVLPARVLPLKSMVEDGCLLLASAGSAGSGGLQGLAGLDLQSGSIKLLMAERNTVLAPLLDGLERLAVSFGMQHCQLRAGPDQASALLKLGYRPDLQVSGPSQRSLSRRLTSLARKAGKLQHELGVPADYGRTHRLRLQPEPRQLASIGADVFGREQFLIPPAASALHAMIAAAAADSSELQVVSAFRSVDYQASLVRNKLQKGQSMEQILRVTAAPGYSEHHSGRAVDFTTPDYAHLGEDFADSAAFTWLSQHAYDFGFRLSYPHGNRHGVAYEPWHWYYLG